MAERLKFTLTLLLGIAIGLGIANLIFLIVGVIHNG